MSTQPRLLDFFLSLNDDEALKKFQADPEAAMADAGLSAEEKALVMSGNEAAVRRALGDQSQALGIRYTVEPPATRQGS